ncbi:MAG TPA: hypothetical protein VN841_09700 [Bryobacteraceae bacterium]|nr:hypothetical protein [Bryobacteraceae bacterium]
MTGARAASGVIAIRTATLCAILWTPLLAGADFSTYRGFQFGASLAASAKQAGIQPSEATLVQKRPAAIQELEWRPRTSYQEDSQKADPVREVLLRFYNGELFQIVTTYDREKVSGMTAADMVEMISRTYGTATKPAAEVAYHSNYGEAAPVIARWENPEYSYNLVQTGDRTSFALVLNSKRLDALARAAMVEAARLDALEAPQRAIDLQNKLDADDRLVLDQARSANLPNFRP